MPTLSAQATKYIYWLPTITYIKIRNIDTGVVNVLIPLLQSEFELIELTHDFKSKLVKKGDGTILYNLDDVAGHPYVIYNHRNHLRIRTNDHMYIYKHKSLVVNDVGVVYSSFNVHDEYDVTVDGRKFSAIDYAEIKKYDDTIVTRYFIDVDSRGAKRYTRVGDINNFFDDVSMFEVID